MIPYINLIIQGVQIYQTQNVRVPKTCDTHIKKCDKHFRNKNFGVKLRNFKEKKKMKSKVKKNWVPKQKTSNVVVKLNFEVKKESLFLTIVLMEVFEVGVKRNVYIVGSM